VLRNILINDAYLNGISGNAVVVDSTDLIITGPVVVHGRVGTATAGVLSVSGVTDPLLDIDLKLARTKETATGTFTASLHIDNTEIDSSAGAVPVTLQNGLRVSQRKTFTMSDASNSSTVSVTTHETSSPEVFTFAQTTDVLVLEWTGALWWTVKNLGVTT
jgi:hypothetical protein